MSITAPLVKVDSLPIDPVLYERILTKHENSIMSLTKSLKYK